MADPASFNVSNGSWRWRAELSQGMAAFTIASHPAPVQSEHRSDLPPTARLSTTGGRTRRRSAGRQQTQRWFRVGRPSRLVECLGITLDRSFVKPTCHRHVGFPADTKNYPSRRSPPQIFLSRGPETFGQDDSARTPLKAPDSWFGPEDRRQTVFFCDPDFLLFSHIEHRRSELASRLDLGINLALPISRPWWKIVFGNRSPGRLEPPGGTETKTYPQPGKRPETCVPKMQDLKRNICMFQC